MTFKKVSKSEIIKHMSDRARSFARVLEKGMSVKGVEVNGKSWQRKCYNTDKGR